MRMRGRTPRAHRRGACSARADAPQNTRFGVFGLCSGQLTGVDRRNTLLWNIVGAQASNASVIDALHHAGGLHGVAG